MRPYQIGSDYYYDNIIQPFLNSLSTYFTALVHDLVGVFLYRYDNMMKGELQTEDGFQIVSTKQEPSLIMNVKTEPEEDDTESYALLQQNVKSEIETDQQFEGKSEPNFNY